MKRFFFLLAFAATAATAANVKLDTMHSKVEFTVLHMMISNVTGRFDKVDGSAVIDEKANQLKSMTVTIDTASVNTNQEKRDGHLKSADFFDAGKFPQITFKVEKPVTLRKGAAVAVPGVITIRGVSKPLTLNFTWRGSIKDPYGMTRHGFEATGKINRKDFGVSWNKAMDGGGFVVGNDVHLQIAGEATEEK